jgi:hypothetical protein
MSSLLRPPVLFAVFNRPDTTRRVFEAIRSARPRRLYVAADGPRTVDEAARCDEVRRIATAVDWDCELKTMFRDRNLGCGKAISGALDWFFGEEREGIVLEDDCLPDPSFFRFCEELLDRYRDEPAVMAITGDCYYGAHSRPRQSYFFSRMVDTWGWASWSRAWRLNDRAMSRWPQLRASDWLLEVGDGRRDFKRYWTQMFDSVHSGRLNVWAYQWAYSCWLAGGVSILPSRNLVRHLGYGDQATHAAYGGWLERLPLEAIDFPLAHPPTMERDLVADRWMFANLFPLRTEQYRRILRRIPGMRFAVRQLRRVAAGP